LIKSYVFRDSVKVKKMANATTVKDIMQKDVKTAENNTVLKDVIALMTKNDKDAVLVIQSGKPTGIITKGDLIIRAMESEVPIRTIIARMVYTNPLVVIDQCATLKEAAELMKHWNIKHLPAVDKNGALVGMVDATQLIFADPKLMTTLDYICRK
jgi:Predicted signal-transduction protein containing cAMP-binding and CBS domains